MIRKCCCYNNSTVFIDVSSSEIMWPRLVSSFEMRTVWEWREHLVWNFVETVLTTQWHLYMSSAITSSIALKMYENSIICRKRLCFALFFLFWDYHALSQTWDWISRLIVCNGSQHLQIYFQLISGVVLSHLVISSFDFEWLAVECLYTLVLCNFTLSHCFLC